MDGLNPSGLFALSYDVLPELREQRDQYYRFWYAIGAMAISGWFLVYLFHRTRPLAARTLVPTRVIAGVVG